MEKLEGMTTNLKYFDEIDKMYILISEFEDEITSNSKILITLHQIEEGIYYFHFL